MEKPFGANPGDTGETAPLSFNLNQAAALCGISVQQLREWTDCGYIRATGHGDQGRYNRDALRQILAVRDAVRTGRLAHRRPRRCQAVPDPVLGDYAPERRRPEEFSVARADTDDDRLALQVELFFALNSGVPQTTVALAHRFDVDPEQMRRVLDGLVHARQTLQVRCNHETLYFWNRAALRGPSPREQRIRAARRRRTPSRSR